MINNSGAGERPSLRRSLAKSAQQLLGRFPAVHRAIRSVWSPPTSIYQHLLFDGPFTVPVDPGASFKMISYSNVVENELFWRGYAGTWEKQSLELWRDLVRKAEYILDVGANTGVYALAASALNPHAKILAIEPAQRVFARLKRNIELNDFPIDAVAVAASDREGTATFYDFAGDHEYSASLEASMGGTIETTVPVVTLDRLLAGHGFPRVDLMKIDVERHEPAVLRGMRGFLEKHRPILLIEILDDECRTGITEALHDLDYRWEQVEGDLNFLLTPD